MKMREPRIFVVDDDRSVRTSLANLLATEDYSVEIFATAAEYLARVPHLGPACLVLDVQLPGLDGLALQEQLTKEGRTEQIVFITGHGNLPMGIGAMKRGAVDFLPKPFRDDELLSAVAQALAHSTENWQQRGEVAESRARLAKLTPREFEVLRLVIAGLLKGDRCGTWHHAPHDEGPSRPRDAEDGRPFPGGAGNAGAESWRHAAAA
jgi:FixJ family two-component response regulator